MTPRTPRLFLIGYRGTGKSTVAARLAEHLGWDWIDADTILQERAGCSIRAIFATEGEDSFRTREAAILTELSCRANLVIATGGGVVIRPANRALLKSSGFVVWLTGDAATLWQRLQADANSADHRPPLTSHSGRAEIEALLQQREPWYRECADLTVDTSGHSPEDVAEIILKALA